MENGRHGSCCAGGVSYMRSRFASLWWLFLTGSAFSSDPFVVIPCCAVHTSPLFLELVLKLCIIFNTSSSIDSLHLSVFSISYILPVLNHAPFFERPVCQCC